MDHLSSASYHCWHNLVVPLIWKLGDKLNQNTPMHIRMAMQQSYCV
jgi:hypothetical protein